MTVARIHAPLEERVADQAAELNLLRGALTVATHVPFELGKLAGRAANTADVVLRYATAAARLGWQETRASGRGSRR